MIKPLDTTTGKRVRHSPRLDDGRRYITDDPTPSKLASLLKAVDEGDIAALSEIATEIEGKDTHIQSVAMLRRQSVTELEWSIEPKDDEDRTAVEAAKYIQSQLESMLTWEETLEHLMTALGPGVSVSELVWHHGELVETNDVPGHRLTGHIDNPSRIGILTDAEPINGIPATEGKFVVHTPNCRAGFPLRVTLTRASIWPWIIKHHSVVDWVAFSETFGTPFKHWKYDPTATPEEIKDLENIAKHSGPDSYAVTAEGINLSLVESGKGSHPGEMLDERMDKKLSILWLGQTLTTDAPDRGSFALGKVHENVRVSITRHDIKTERRTIGRYVIAPMVRLKWPGRDVPIPWFKRTTFESRDLDAERMDMEKLRYADERNLLIDDKDRYELLNLPMPKGGRE